jgi:hypothetical protein
MLGATLARISLWQQRICTEETTVISNTKRLYTLDGELFRSNDETIKISMGPQLEFLSL